MEFTNIIYEKNEGVAKIVLNRPDVLNALDPKTLEEMYAAIEDIESDISVRVAIITATGRAFCTGADLTGIATIPPDKPRDYFLRLWNQVFSAIENVSVPTIAAINGMAYAGGLELVLVCDLAIASEEAKLSDQHANRGLVPGGGASQRLPRLIGVRKAKELLYTGDRISPAEAERLGLINEAVPADKLEEATNELAQKLLVKSPMALKAVKKLVNRGMEGSLDSGLEMEMLAVIAHGTTEDCQEGVKSFLEGRPPAFPGR
ncbi:MAG: enoyl-CoA hydratase/isomerase family protein [Dehalococcoidia bacterium]|nr:MAG: enoyl-CoA hydratase/isomerase family protein [Dehalococcoidia bacterium]